MLQLKSDPAHCRSLKKVFTCHILTVFAIVVLLAGCTGGRQTAEEQPEATTTVQEVSETPATNAEEESGEGETESSSEVNEQAPAPYVRGFDGTPLYGGTLVVARNADPATCNPAGSGATDLNTAAMLGNVFDALTRQNEAMEPQPQLATSWEIEDDGLTITFHLRDDVFWHDGVPFTSADVKFTYENVLSKLQSRGMVNLSTLESVETPDDYTVIFHFNEPKASALWQVNAPEGAIVPKHIYENEDLVEGPHASCEELPIGTGPFKVVEYVQGQHMILERNDDWWGKEGDYWGVGQPYLDRIVYQILPDVTTRMNCLEIGECHYVGMQMLPLNEVERVQAMPGKEVIDRCTSQMVGVTNMYGLNLRREIFQDVRVRQAISWALDRDRINQQVFFNTGVPTAQIVPPSHPWYSPDAPTYQPRDLERANALLDEAGYPRGEDGIRFEITLTHDTRSTQTDMANIFQQMMEDVGIKVNIETLDFAASVDKVYIQHDFDVYIAIVGVGAEPSVWFHTDNIGPSPFNNYSAYSNPEMDELWDLFGRAFDPQEQQEYARQIMNIAANDLPYIFVMSSDYPLAIDTANFDGFHPDCSRGDALLRTVWWKGGRPAP